MSVKIEGLNRVIKNFESIANSSTDQSIFINTISDQILYLLRNNTPVETGQLKNSWREIYKTRTTLGIGTTADQIPKLKYIIFGTKDHDIEAKNVNYLRFEYPKGSGIFVYRKKVHYLVTQPNDFLTPIMSAISDNIFNVFKSQLKQSHPYFRYIQGGYVRFSGTKTASDIVGNTGLKFVKRRGRGRSFIGIIKTGKKSLRSRIGRPRRV